MTGSADICESAAEADLAGKSAAFFRAGKHRKKGKAILSFRWAIRFSVLGDLRFCSHHDMMRAIERLAVRSGLPLYYSQGFNPRPVISLPAARPVGISGEDEILCINFDSEILSAELLESLNNHALPGLTFISAAQLSTSRATPQILSITYSMELCGDETANIASKIDELKKSAQWLLERKVKPSSRRGGRKRDEDIFNTLDIKPRVSAIEIVGGKLIFTLVPCEESWAKPGEVLELVGMAGPRNVARLTRTKIKTDINHI